jgi:hypothetical protein
MEQRTPLGVVATIVPWNFPLALLAMKVAPALISRSAPLRFASRPGWHQKCGSANYATGPIIAGSPEAAGAILPYRTLEYISQADGAPIFG